MIEKKLLINDFEDCWALWCGINKESADLARAAEVVSENNLPMISVVPSAVPVIWPWLENFNTKIMARFYLSEARITECAISDVVKKINLTFKQGANGAQVFLSYADIGAFVDYMHAIRDDLFFDKSLSIGLDLNEVGAFDWGDLFANLKKINANSLLLVFAKDMGNKSDFVGRIYAMLNAWGADNNFELHFVVGPDLMRIEQVLRLTEMMRPQLIKRIRFFVNF